MKKYKPEDFETPSKEVIKEAKNNPNGYVYAIDEDYQTKENVPPEHIIGYWTVDEKGTIIGSFIYNPNHWSKLS